ncbi:MAG: hypothetical protein M9894_31060 [Planctomycetes bacterium]|nr:hypothetical protein [Planctomycetota bacterium]
MERGELDLAVELLREDARGFGDPSVGAALLGSAGELEMMLGRPAEALRAFDGAMAADPAAPLGSPRRAWALAALGRHDDAAAELERGARGAPGHYVELVRAALALELDPRGAAAACEAALRGNPHFQPARRLRMRARLALGDAAGARDDALALVRWLPRGHPWSVEALEALERGR